jgi:mannan endo-1,4-beta-mannosidase
VYWLGLDENVIPPAGQPFYAPFNASYPTKGRTTEVMATLATMGAKLIRSQTLGISVGNPLSLMPTLGVINEEAYETIDWAVFQARQHGLRIIAPLTDNYVSSCQYRSCGSSNSHRIIITAEDLHSCVGLAST